MPNLTEEEDLPQKTRKSTKWKNLKMEFETRLGFPVVFG
jgi:hypothetical protein